MLADGKAATAWWRSMWSRTDRPLTPLDLPIPLVKLNQALRVDEDRAIGTEVFGNDTLKSSPIGFREGSG